MSLFYESFSVIVPRQFYYAECNKVWTHEFLIRLITLKGEGPPSVRPARFYLNLNFSEFQTGHKKKLSMKLRIITRYRRI